MAARSLRIALVSYHTSPFEPLGTGEAGGMNVVIAHHAQELAARGHEVEILTRRADTSSPEVEYIAPRLRLHYLPAGEPRRYPKGELDAFVQEFSRAMRVLARLDGVAPRCRWDLIHAHHWMSALAAEETVLAANVPLVFSYHSIAAPVGATLADGEPAESPARIAGEERAAQLAHRVIAVSQYEATAVAERYAACNTQMTVLLPGWTATCSTRWLRIPLVYLGRCPSMSCYLRVPTWRWPPGFNHSRVSILPLKHWHRWSWHIARPW
ncbi:glycosyltransferase [Actinobaculum sp. 313]|uniref:glycosyltransferase n=1 Tax=Actinobaculum sp. 313 TaxID=2495645 RepID=UPI0013DE1877|nr:glycosyltransferase [Actinobaculum sp. 313]